MNATVKRKINNGKKRKRLFRKAKQMARAAKISTMEK
jgi:hypothetical protein